MVGLWAVVFGANVAHTVGYLTYDRRARPQARSDAQIRPEHHSQGTGLATTNHAPPLRGACIRPASATSASCKSAARCARIARWSYGCSWAPTAPVDLYVAPRRSGEVDPLPSCASWASSPREPHAGAQSRQLFGKGQRVFEFSAPVAADDGGAGTSDLLRLSIVLSTMPVDGRAMISSARWCLLPLLLGALGAAAILLAWRCHPRLRAGSRAAGPTS